AQFPQEHCELRGQFPQEHCSPQTLHFLSPLTTINSVHLPFTFFLHFSSSMAITSTHCPSPSFPLPSTCPVTYSLLHAYSISNHYHNLQYLHSPTTSFLLHLPVCPSLANLSPSPPFPPIHMAPRQSPSLMSLAI